MAFMDVKIGKKTYEEDASEEKKAKEMAKLTPGTTGEQGYRLVGVQAGLRYGMISAAIKVRGGLSTDAFIQEGITPFFADGEVADPASAWPAFSVPAVDESLVALDKLQAVVDAGYGGVMRAASVFMGREMKPGGKSCVRVIDLAHFTPSAGVDDNFAEGLRAFIAVLRQRRALQSPGQS